MENIDNHIRKGIKLEVEKKQNKEEIEEVFVRSKNDKINFLKEKEETKSELEKKIISLSGKYIQKYTEELGLENINTPKENDIYFTLTGLMQAGTYEQNSDIVEIASVGSMKKIKHVLDLLNLNKDKFEKFKKLSSVLHESIHYSGYNMRKLLGDTNQTKNRSGFSTKNSEGVTYFSSLNEVVTEFIKDEILDKNFEEIKRELKMKNVLGINEKLYKKLNILFSKSYLMDRNFIKHIIEESRIDINDLKKGYFTGNMLPLRKIEETYGPGSLRILALMDTKMILEFEKSTYFDLNTPIDIREKMKKNIIDKLSNYEKDKIDNHIQKMMVGEKEN